MKGGINVALDQIKNNYGEGIITMQEVELR